MNDLSFLSTYTIPVIVIICLCVGFVIKKWIKDVDNKYIPTICSILGIFLAIWINSWRITPESISCGLVSGLASTGCHQLLKQLLDGKGLDQILKKLIDNSDQK